MGMAGVRGQTHNAAEELHGHAGYVAIRSGFVGDKT
jgi:hypothetical protein